MLLQRGAVIIFGLIVSLFFYSRRFILLSLLVLLLNAAFFLLVTDFSHLAEAMSEQGLIENIQLLYLGLAALGFFIGALRLRAEPRMFLTGMAVLMLVFFFRELEVEPVGGVSSYLKSRAFRWHEAFVVLLIAGTYIFSKKQYLRAVIGFIFSRAAWPFYLAAGFVLLGEVFEKMYGFSYHEFAEEMLESLSYLLLLCLAVHAALLPSHKAATAVHAR